MTSRTRSILDASIREIGSGFRNGSWTPREVAVAALDRLEDTEPDVRAWVLVDRENAVAAADQAEAELRAGIDRGPLHGVPLGVKDIFDVAGWATRCGSAARRDAPPETRDAKSIATLRDAGAVLLGKTVTQEFAAGVISQPARNPWDTSRVPGGSSGGSAASVALGACFGAMGSDTGGSIRIPAAACGVVGFKPAYGQIDVAGVYPLSWSLDTVGPLARGVDDAWILWRALLDDRDPGEIPGDLRLDGVRIGVPRPFFFDALQPRVREKVAEAVDILRALDAVVVDVDWPLASTARAAAFVINRVETASVHERTALAEPERFMLYGADLRLRIAAGLTVPAALYLRAVRARETIRASMQELFLSNALDAIVAPTLPTTAVPVDDTTIEGTGLDESIGASWTRLTMPFNTTGQPVLAVPCGFDQQGLPVGIQFAGPPGRESDLFRIGLSFERALGLGNQRPPLPHRAAGKQKVGEARDRQQ